MRKMNVAKKLFVTFICIFLFSCEKLVEVEGPITSINSQNVYSTDATAISVLTGIFTNVSSSSLAGGGLTSISLLTALSSDEISLFSGNTNATYIYYYTNALTNVNVIGADFWSNIYPIIFSANSAIEGITNSTTLEPSVKKQLIGEAKFIRAFCFFYLINLYGDVPLTNTSNYKINSVLSRTPKAQVYAQIIADLQDAKASLSSEFMDISLLKTTTERIRPNKWAAIALLARVYLYTGKYSEAEASSTAVMNESLFNILPLNEVFLKNSQEAIWQLQPVIAGFNTQEAQAFILTVGLNDGLTPFFLNNNLLNSFEPNDERKSNWVGVFEDTLSIPNKSYYYPYKYKSATYNDPVIEYSMVLRLTEQYLIRAESRVLIGNLKGGADDLNIIRSRAGLIRTAAKTQAELLSAILHERQVELFTEWGHRWFDLKRTGTVNSVMSIVTSLKGGTWNPNWQFYPLPLTDLQHDPNLKQNEGY